MELGIRGRVLAPSKKYSTDRSPYEIKPTAVAIPVDERDVVDLVNYARANTISITARGAGSNLSGSAVGNGLIVDFTRMNFIQELSGKTMRVGPGVIFNDINKKARSKNFFLPYDPSSGSFCTIGGNVSTKAAGLHSVKYGSVDNAVKSMRFVDFTGRIIDTADNIPLDMEQKISSLRNQLLSDSNVMALLKKREGLKTSSGYNICALYKYKKISDIVTHLLVGSVGTLGLITEIELALTPLPKNKITCLAYFNSLKDSGSAVMEIKNLKPSGLEIMDSFSLDILRRHKFAIPDAKAALLIEFDSKLTKSDLEKILRNYKASYAIETSPKKQEHLWNVRRSLLTLVEKGKKVKAFVEDIGVPPQHIASFIVDLQNIFTKNKIGAVIFGHAGEGNLHLRPVIPKRNWKVTVKKIADACYGAALKYGGTITAEHGIGRNKAPYVKQEWGNEIYEYFREIKYIFDPEGIFNPGVMFSDVDITEGMKY